LAAEDILGYQVVNVSKEDCIEAVADWMEKAEQKKYFLCLNPHSYEVAQKDPLFHKAILNADLVVPDGVGIVWASKILGGSITERVTGSDIFEGFTSVMNARKDLSCFFLGSTEQNLSIIKEKMAVEFPHVRIAGCYSPPFKKEFDDEDNRQMLRVINKEKPDVLWVGMTAPKQEKWIYRNKEQLENVKFIGAIGAVFDFYAGTVKRSHPFFQKYGLEWLPRFMRQPVKLWRRNCISSPLFLLRVLKEKNKYQAS